MSRRVASEFWLVHEASGPDGVRIKSAIEGRGLAPGSRLRFAYVITQDRELLPHEEALRAICEGRPRARLIKVAVRKTFREATILAKRWAS